MWELGPPALKYGSVMVVRGSVTQSIAKEDTPEKQQSDPITYELRTHGDWHITIGVPTAVVQWTGIARIQSTRGRTAATLGSTP